MEFYNFTTMVLSTHVPCAFVSGLRVLSFLKFVMMLLQSYSYYKSTSFPASYIILQFSIFLMAFIELQNSVLFFQLCDTIYESMKHLS